MEKVQAEDFSGAVVNDTCLEDPDGEPGMQNVIKNIFITCDLEQTDMVPVSRLIEFIRPFTQGHISELNELKQALDPDNNDASVGLETFCHEMTSWATRISGLSLNTIVEESERDNEHPLTQLDGSFEQRGEDSKTETTLSVSKLSGFEEITHVDPICMLEQVKELDHQNCNLRKELENVKTLLGHADEQIYSLQTEVKQFSKKLSLARHANDELLKTSIVKEELEENAEIAQKEIAKLHKLLALSHKDINRLESILEAVKDEKLLLENKIELLEKYCDESKSSITEMKSESNYKNQMIAALHENNSKFKTELVEKQQLVDHYRSMYKELKLEKSKLEMNFHEALANNTLLNQQKTFPVASSYSDNLDSGTFKYSNVTNPICKYSVGCTPEYLESGFSFNSPKLLQMLQNPISPNISLSEEPKSLLPPIFTTPMHTSTPKKKQEGLLCNNVQCVPYKQCNRTSGANVIANILGCTRNVKPHLNVIKSISPDINFNTATGTLNLSNSFEKHLLPSLNIAEPVQEKNVNSSSSNNENEEFGKFQMNIQTPGQSLQSEIYEVDGISTNVTIVHKHYQEIIRRFQTNIQQLQDEINRKQEVETQVEKNDQKHQEVQVEIGINDLAQVNQDTGTINLEIKEETQDRSSINKHNILCPHCQDFKNKLKELQLTKDELQSKLRVMETEIHKRKNFERMLTQIDRLKQKIEELQATNQQLQCEKQRNLENFTQEKGNFCKEKKIFENKLTKLSNCEKRLGEVLCEVRAVTEEKDSAVMKNSVLEQKVQLLQKEKLRLKDIEEKSIKQYKELKKIKNEKLDIEEELMRANSKMKELEQTLTNTQLSVKRLIKEKTVAMKDQINLHEQVNKLQGDVSKLDVKNKDLVLIKNQTIMHNVECEKMHAEQYRRQESQMESVSAQNAHLLQQIHVMMNNEKENDESIARLRDELQRCKLENMTLREQFSAFQKASTDTVQRDVIDSCNELEHIVRAETAPDVTLNNLSPIMLQNGITNVESQMEVTTLTHYKEKQEHEDHFTEDVLDISIEEFMKNLRVFDDVPVVLSQMTDVLEKLGLNENHSSKWSEIEYEEKFSLMVLNITIDLVSIKKRRALQHEHHVKLIEFFESSNEKFLGHLRHIKDVVKYSQIRGKLDVVCEYMEHIFTLFAHTNRSSLQCGYLNHEKDFLNCVTVMINHSAHLSKKVEDLEKELKLQRLNTRKKHSSPSKTNTIEDPVAIIEGCLLPVEQKLVLCKTSSLSQFPWMGMCSILFGVTIFIFCCIIMEMHNNYNSLSYPWNWVSWEEMLQPFIKRNYINGPPPT